MIDWGKIFIFIGVIGKPGAGKTTFTDFWNIYDNVGIIHIDEIWDKICEKYFGIFFNINPKNKMKQPNNSIKKKIYSKKITFDLLMFVKEIVIKKEIKNRIKQFEKNGCDIIILEDTFLIKYKKIYSMINKIFFIYRKKSYREYSIINRDKISIESVDIMEIPYKHNYLPKVKGKKVERIYNNGTLEDLEKIMQNKYNKVIKEI